MAILKIKKKSDPVLRKNCREIDEITPRILTLLDDLIDTMREADGCGLAASQVGVLRRAAVIETEPGTVYELINPVITERSGTQNEVEGCLSFPGIAGVTDRPMYVRVTSLDRQGNHVEFEGEGLLARAFCHEIDHLDGKTIYDSSIRMLTEKEIEERNR